MNCANHAGVQMVEVSAQLGLRHVNARGRWRLRTKKRAQRVILRCPVPGCARVEALPGEEHKDEAEEHRAYGAPLSPWKWRQVEKESGERVIGPSGD